MHNKLRVLLVSPYLPAIDTTACARKIYDHIILLHQKGYPVYLFSFCSDEDKERISAIKPYCTQLYLEYIRNYSRYSSNLAPLRKKIELCIRNQDIDILQCEKAYMSQYLPEGIDASSVLIEHEVLSASFSEMAKLENNFIRKLILYLRKTKKRHEEKRWYRRFDKVIVFSEDDKDILRKLYNIQDIEIIPLGVNLENYPLQHRNERPYDIIFVGNFSHFPNVDAVLYFYGNILPLIKDRLPNISVIIAGANPPADIKKLAESDKNIFVTGYVKDILEMYSKSKVFIAPIRYGTGMRYKVLEAMATRIPVVTTSIGARGILFKENFRIADTKEAFADKVIELLSNPDSCDGLTEKARLAVEKYYNWDTLLDRYENVYHDLYSR